MEDNIYIQRTEQIIISKKHPKYKIIDEMCFKAKNLYNYANYIIRKSFIEEEKYIQYYDLNRELKSHQQYKDVMSQPANCILRILDKNWKSFFVSIKDWSKNKGKYLGKPKLPKYLKKDGRFLWMIPNNSCYYKDDGTIHFKIKKLQGYIWKSRCLGRLIQVRFVPKGSCYVMEIVYEIEVPDVSDKDSERIAAIDLGVNNLVTMTNNIGLNPIIINGKGIKNINQFYNKRVAKEKSLLKIRHKKDWSNKLNRITFKRNQRIRNYLHNTSAYIVKWCVENNIDALVVGYNKKQKQNINIGNNNQKFVMIPHKILIQQLSYKCQNKEIGFVLTEESYTSGTSFLDNEFPTEENYKKSRRVQRGLFKSNSGQLINSDVNGSLQIMKKVFPNAFDRCYGIEGFLTPTVINAVKIA